MCKNCEVLIRSLAGLFQMADHFDFLQLLNPELALKILSYLDDSDDLIRASEVSPFWRDFLIANGICKQLCVRIFPPLANVAGISELNDGKKKSVDVGSSNYMHWEALDREQWEALDREHRVYASLFKALTTIKVINCLAHAISASSTDNYPEKSIRNTLDPGDQILRRASYWSSKGQSNPEVPETLIYKLRDDFCVITEINIQPFQAYSSKSVRFRMGQPKFPSDIDKDLRRLPLQQHADEKFIWTYTSQDFPMSQENHVQNFKLSEPVLCIGGFLQIELLGRVQTQATDDLFYICVSHVEVLGRPLSPAFLVDIGPPEKFYLKYSPEALLRTLQNGSPPTPSSAEHREPRMWGHLGGLMQRNEQGGELIEWEDDEDNEWDHML